jgi:hypothetical protein
LAEHFNRDHICDVPARALYKDTSAHKVKLKWERGDAEFSYQKYPRDHTWSFDGGHTITAMAVLAYLGNPAHVDPEEAFVASLSSCHMLTLAIALRSTSWPRLRTRLWLHPRGLRDAFDGKADGARTFRRTSQFAGVNLGFSHWGVPLSCASKS